jgi:hypothetical protein
MNISSIERTKTKGKFIERKQLKNRDFFLKKNLILLLNEC